jgi:predicted Na+-dependent transporter
MLKALLVGIAIALFLFAADWIGQHNYGRIMGAIGFVILIPVFVAVVIQTVRGGKR